MMTHQTTHWARPLALIVGLGTLWTAALSADVTLNIVPAVHVTWPTTTNKAYQVQASTSLTGNWVPIGELIEGNGGQVGAWFETDAARQFFKAQETTASGINWLEGTWQGDTYQANSNSVPFKTRMSIANASRTFSASYSNNLISCSANLGLLSFSDTQARFYSSVQSGGCAEGIVVVTRVNTTNLLYSWYYRDGPTLASSFAVLVKSQ
jgi:hypothetical protein